MLIDAVLRRHTRRSHKLTREFSDNFLAEKKKTLVFSSA
jgi:hypothetical protein